MPGLARGTVVNLNPGGTHCGFSRPGEVNRIKISIGSFYDELSGPGLVHAGPYAMTWPVTPFSDSSGVGRATLALLDVPEGGLNPATGFAGEHSFRANFSVTWAKP